MRKETEFKIVYVPCDSLVSIEEWTIQIPKGKEVECLMDRLKGHFHQSRFKPDESQKEKIKEEIMKKVPEEKRATVTDDILDKLSMTNMVELVCLIPNLKEYEYVAVNMYIDDKSTIKDLPLNGRATELASCCGVNAKIHGDAFIARVRETEEEFDRLDFGIEDMSSSSVWIEQARKFNYSKQMQGNSAQKLLDNINDDRNKKSNKDYAKSEKELGNIAFKKGNYERAIDYYNSSIKYEKNSIVYSNRAAAYLKLEKFDEALNDAVEALNLDSNNVKARFRKACALENLNKKDEAINEFNVILEKDPNNVEVNEKLQKLSDI